ncbi:MAG: bifunctional phosphopantothenoylcysteine decarboxylase/phosphopantothenate--cysteine ligase CoaBC, partial [Gammaproteobacteria bacterium]|nr:bifunctional phosphopantothenoylcysteine decarboxylase/phosphopantothenate--cysteine ligase CoaBC [Gammaproteobacteria bacterium]
IHIVGPDSGSQACGETGEGRMLDPDEIAAIVSGLQVDAGATALLACKTVLITAGPTREPIDPVRFITNRSSGKMGYAIAAAAQQQGAQVVLISGPVAITAPRGVIVHEVQTAQEMYDTTHVHIRNADIFIATAAVADYRPVAVAAHKIKKNEQSMSIELVRTPDILTSVAALESGPFTVGFAAETENLREYALGKLRRKNLDMIVANLVGAGCGFDRDDNAVEVFWQGGEQAFATDSKVELARRIVKLVAERCAIT